MENDALFETPFTDAFLKVAVEHIRGYERMGDPVPGTGPITSVRHWCGVCVAFRAPDEAAPPVPWGLNPKTGQWEKLEAR